MSYNILNKNVTFQGATQGTIEDVVDTHTAQAISGSKDFNVLTGSNTHVVNTISVATHAVDHAVSVAGAVSASLNISASAFYADGVLLGDGGAVSSVANGADNRIATFSSADALNGESNLTFDGSVLDFNATSISGSGNISGSQFYGTWSGANMNGSQIQLASNGGIDDSSGLRVNPSSMAAVSSLAGSDSISIYSTADSAPKKTTVSAINALAAVSSFGNGADDRVVTATGGSSLNGEANMRFDGSALKITGSISGSTTLQIGGTLKIDGCPIEAPAYAADHILFVDATDSLVTKATFSNFSSAIAGDGLANASGRLEVGVSGAVKIASDKVGITGSFADLGLAYEGGVDSISSIKLDLNSLADTNMAVADDFVVFIDADDSQPKKEQWADIVTNMGGTGLDSSGGQLSVDVSDFLANGANNRIVTATGTDAMNAEANLSFDGSVLILTGSMEVSGSGITVRGGEGGTAAISLMADQGDDANDTASISVGDGGVMTIDTGGSLTLDTDAGTLLVKDNNVEFSSLNKASIQTDAVYADSLVLSASAGAMKFDSFIGTHMFASASATRFSIGSSGNHALLQPSGDAANDIIFTDGDESMNEIGRFDSSATALLMAGSNKVMFNDGGTYINSSTNSQLDIVSDGSVVFANTSTTIFTPSSVHNFTGNDANATIPITATYQKIDANGSSRTGMRFGGTGTAGQFLIVENAGGENVTFDPSAGTALITTNTDNDTIMPGEIVTFVSNGSTWFLIGGDLQAG